MKRLLAVLAAVCCLLLCVPLAAAEPAAPAESGSLTGEADPVQDGLPEENQTYSENQPQAEPETQAPAESEDQPPADPLAGETHIQSLNLGTVLDGGGKAAVTQTWELAIEGTLTQVRFAVPQGASKAQVTGQKTKASTENGVRYLTVTNEAGFTGVQTFTLTYTQGGLVTGSGEGQTLSLPLLAAQIYPVTVMHFSVTLPESFEAKPHFTSGYFQDMIGDSLDVTAAGGIVTGVTLEPLKDHETLAMTLSLPAGYFSGRYGQGVLEKLLTAVTLLLAAVTVLYWWRTLRNEPLRVQARTLPPDGVNPGDLPYLLSGGDADFNMLVSYWATLGYVSFYINQSGHVILRRRMGMGNERRLFERKLFNLLFGGEAHCDGASLRYKKVGERAMAVIPRYWTRRLYSRESGSPFLIRMLCCLVCALATLQALDPIAPEKLHGLLLLMAFIAGFALCWMIYEGCGAYYLNDWVRTGVGVCCGLLLLILGGLGGATLVMVPSVALAVFVGWQTAHGGRRSAYGAEVVAQTLGFRRFIHNASDHHLMQMLRRDPQYFYKMLPYAEAMGQGKRFVAQFHDAQLEPCQWYETANGAPRTAAAFYEHYCETLAMLNVSIRK